jgi:predicted transposase/invertase (TIGR01784 family)
MRAKKNYKNNLFIWLFSNPAILRELYNALAGTNYDESVKIEINTLQDVLFLDRKNDISFIIGNKIVVFIEHQSTINENMPLRLLIYITRLYEKIIESLGKNKIYREKLVKIPRPEFYVFYNGTADYPAEKVLRLSDAFESMGQKDDPPLELTVKVININKGKNKELEQKSTMLSDYAFFVKKTRDFFKELEPQKLDDKKAFQKAFNEAIEKAIHYCIENNILKDILIKFSSEVSSMLFTEWNLNDAKEAWKEEAWEEGMEEGREEGLEEGIRLMALNLKKTGMSYAQIAELSNLSLEEIERL